MFRNPNQDQRWLVVVFVVVTLILVLIVGGVAVYRQQQSAAPAGPSSLLSPPYARPAGGTVQVVVPGQCADGWRTVISADGQPVRLRKDSEDLNAPASARDLALAPGAKVLVGGKGGISAYDGDWNVSWVVYETAPDHWVGGVLLDTELRCESESARTTIACDTDNSSHQVAVLPKTRVRNRTTGAEETLGQNGRPVDAVVVRVINPSTVLVLVDKQDGNYEKGPIVPYEVPTSAVVCWPQD